MSDSLIYRILKRYVKFSARFYFRKIEVHGLENIPEKGAVIFAGNHQNAFLDAILIHIVQPRPPHFLTRGDVFNNPWANTFLRSLKMRPIFRFRDGMANMKKNRSTFSECYDILEQGEALGIFPEGNQDLRFFLRPLQKGCARIVFETLERNEFNLSVKVVPMGIQYYGNQNSRADVLIQFGKPIDSMDFTALFADEKAFLTQFTKQIESGLKPLILNIPEPDYQAHFTHWKQKRSRHKSLKNTFENDVKILSNQPYEDWKHSGALMNVITLPFALCGAINHLVSYPVFVLLAHNLVKDRDFRGSVKFVLAIIYFPIIYLMQSLMLAPWLGYYSILYFISLPLTGIAFRDMIAAKRLKL